MVGGVRGQWEKFPKFIEYANDCTTFQHETEEARQYARGLVTFIFLDLKSPTIGTHTGKVNLKPSFSRILWFPNKTIWSDDIVWKELSANWSDFRTLLDGIINGYFSPIHLQWMEEHSKHLWMQPCWADLSLEKIRKLGGIVLTGFSNRGLKYYECMRIQDPLDGLYWQLREFLRLGGEQRLRKCPVCKRFFIQSTAKPTVYCVRKCRLKNDPRRREADAEYQSRYRKKLRETQIHEELKKVQEAKDRLRAEGGTELRLVWVCDEANISERRLGYLRRWEEKEHGRPRITDLTLP